MVRKKKNPLPISKSLLFWRNKKKYDVCIVLKSQTYPFDSIRLNCLWSVRMWESLVYAFWFTLLSSVCSLSLSLSLSRFSPIACRMCEKLMLNQIKFCCLQNIDRFCCFEDRKETRKISTYKLKLRCERKSEQNQTVLIVIVCEKTTDYFVRAIMKCQKKEP